jgi:2-dehydropantoate 2-reductase
MKIVVLGAGVQGTLYGVRLARAGHDVALVARGLRARELRAQGAVIQHAITGRRDTVHLPVLEILSSDVHADLCLVTVRREQLPAVLPDLARATGITRFVFMVNQANGSGFLMSALGRTRFVLAFPGAAGGVEDGIDHYIEVAEQPTAIEAVAQDIAVIFRAAGFKVSLVPDMDAWLRRHAVFVTAIAGALYMEAGSAPRLSTDIATVRTFILGVREGWDALDKLNVAHAPLALHTIFRWVPLPFAAMYWSHLLGSPRGEYYFARHTRHAAKEMAALADDIRALVPDEPMPRLRRLYAAIDVAASNDFDQMRQHERHVTLD